MPREYENGTFYEGLKRPVRWSLILHAVVFILAIFGLPHVAKDIPVPPPPIIVDLVTPGDITAAPNKNVPKAQQKTEKKTEKEKPKPAVKSEAPEVAEAPPKPKEPEKPKEQEKPKAEKKPAEKPKVEKSPPKKPSDAKSMIEKLAKSKPKEEATEEKMKNDFNSVLKNLAGDNSSADRDIPESPMVIEQDKNAPAGWASTISDTLSISQMDFLQRQLAGCWSIPAGAVDAENLIIDIYVEVNQDRTVKTVEIVDKARYNRDTFFRAAAESAVRAVRNPACSPLSLPPEKYDMWKTMTIRFNPKEMFGG